MSFRTIRQARLRLDESPGAQRQGCSQGSAAGVPMSYRHACWGDLARTARCVLYYVQNQICPTARPSCQREACRPLLDTPCRWRGPRHPASPHQCTVSPLHRQSGPSSPDTLTNLAQFGCAPTSSRLDCDRASFPRTPAPLGQGLRFHSPPCIPHRPTLCGLDAQSPGSGPGVATREDAADVVLCFTSGGALGFGACRVR